MAKENKGPPSDKCVVFLVTTTKEDTIRVYRIQVPRAIRERFRITPVEEGPFSMANFFTIFNDNLNEFTLRPVMSATPRGISKRKKAQYSEKQKIPIKFPIFSNVSWQDCFILLEIFIMNFYLAKRSTELKVKTVNIVPQLAVGNKEDLATNLLSTININILTYYHIWYLYNHSRLDMLIHSWQTILFKQDFMKSYSIICHLASFDTILNWIYSNTKTQIRLMKITCAENGAIFGPFNCSRASENITHSRYNVCFRKFSTSPPVAVDCFNEPETPRNRAFLSLISTVPELSESSVFTVQTDMYNATLYPLQENYHLPTMNYNQPTTNYNQPTTNYNLPKPEYHSTMNYNQPTMNYNMPTMNYNQSKPEHQPTKMDTTATDIQPPYTPTEDTDYMYMYDMMYTDTVTAASAASCFNDIIFEDK